MNVLFLHQANAAFEETDFQILKKNFNCREIPIYRDVLFKIFPVIKAIRKTDIIFCWFAYRAALIPLVIAKIFKKKILIVMGGWDCANAPEIDYGAMRRGYRFLASRMITRYIANLADKIIAISEYNRGEIIKNLGISPGKICLIYCGVNIQCCENGDKDNLILTVGRVSKSNLKRKGLGTFIKIAKMLPELKFVLVGHIDKAVKDYLTRIIPKNLDATGFVSEEELRSFYRRAKVYVQVSYHEQFGCALAEAMAHKCVPVITDRAALPEVVEDAGYRVPYGDAAKSVEAILMALDDNKRGEMAREKIIRLFSLERREKDIVELINSLVQTKII